MARIFDTSLNTGSIPAPSSSGMQDAYKTLIETSKNAGLGGLLNQYNELMDRKEKQAQAEADRAWLQQQRSRQEAEWDRADKERAALDTYNKIASGDRNVVADSITDAYLANKGKYALPEVKESMTPEQKAEVLRAQEEWSKNIVKDPKFLESDLDRLQRAKAAAEKEGVLPAEIYDRIRTSEAAGEQAKQEAIKLADKEVQDSLLAAAKERTRLAELGIKSSGSKSDSKVNAAKAVNEVLKDMKIQPNDATLKQMNLVAQDMKDSGFDQDSIKQAIARGFKPNESGWSNLFMGKGERYEIPNIGLRASNDNVERPVVGDTTTKALLESRYLDALNKRKLLDMTPAEQRAMAIRQGLERVTPEVTRKPNKTSTVGVDTEKDISIGDKVSPKLPQVGQESGTKPIPGDEVKDISKEDALTATNEASKESIKEYYKNKSNEIKNRVSTPWSRTKEFIVGAPKVTDKYGKVVTNDKAYSKNIASVANMLRKDGFTTIEDIAELANVMPEGGDKDAVSNVLHYKLMQNDPAYRDEMRKKQLADAGWLAASTILSAIPISGIVGGIAGKLGGKVSATPVPNGYAGTAGREMLKRDAAYDATYRKALQGNLDDVTSKINKIFDKKRLTKADQEELNILEDQRLQFLKYLKQ